MLIIFNGWRSRLDQFLCERYEQTNKKQWRINLPPSLSKSYSMGNRACLLYSLENTCLKTDRSTNTTTTNTTPVNTIAEFIPIGLNQPSLGGVIKVVPNQTETIIVITFTRIISPTLTFIDKKPTNPANNKVPTNKKSARSGCCEVSK